MAVAQMKDTGQTTRGLADPAHLFPFGREELRRVKQDVSGFPAACARSISTSTQAKNSFPMRNPGSSHSFRSQGLSDVEGKGCGRTVSGSPRHMDLMSRRTFGVTRYFSALAAVVRERKVWLGFMSRCRDCVVSIGAEARSAYRRTVSYTHLTLPTILLV